MNWLDNMKKAIEEPPVSESRVVHIDTESLDWIVESLAYYGRPHLMLNSSGFWFCGVDMNTNVAGADFTIRSEHGRHKKAVDAARECLSRVKAALPKAA